MFKKYHPQNSWLLHHTVFQRVYQGWNRSIDQLQLGEKNSWELRNGTSQWQQNSRVIPKCAMGLEYLLAFTVNVGKYLIHLDMRCIKTCKILDLSPHPGCQWRVKVA